jgi:hypothetical protein
MLTLPKLLSKAQAIFNAWVRDRDAAKGCISCGGSIDHAGHYYSAGHYTALRFNPMNVNGQCLKCNNFLHGNLINYRKGLVKRYGEDEVNKLETYADLRKSTKWDRIELEQIIKTYGKKKGTRGKSTNGNNSDQP